MKLCQSGRHNMDALTPDGAPGRKVNGLRGTICRLCDRERKAKYGETAKGRTARARDSSTEGARKRKRAYASSERGRALHAAYLRKMALERRSAGLCSRGDGRPLASDWFCQPCLNDHNASSARYLGTSAGQLAQLRSLAKQRGSS